jgi:hypothetical protein
VQTELKLNKIYWPYEFNSCASVKGNNEDSVITGTAAAFSGRFG